MLPASDNYNLELFKAIVKGVPSSFTSGEIVTKRVSVFHKKNLSFVHHLLNNC